MANRTFLELVNDVLLELREPTVTTWDENDYSTLIGRFVNKSKRAVENAWKWTALYNTYNIPMVASTVTYALTSTDERAEIMDVFNYSAGWRMSQASLAWMNSLYFEAGGAGVQSGRVDTWIHNGLDASGQTQIDVYPVPDTTDTVILNAWAPQADFTADADAILVPFRPVVETAIALARGERGEDGGISANEAISFAASSAADAIAIDAMKHPDTTMWEAV